MTLTETIKDYWSSSFIDTNLTIFGKVLFFPILLPWCCIISILMGLVYLVLGEDAL